MPAGRTKEIRAAFLPLLDCAALVVAREKGFAAAEGLDLRLEREISWASLRDRMLVHRVEAAQMLAPMAVAARIGLVPGPLDVVVPMALGLGGNAVTVSTALAGEMGEAGTAAGIDPAASGEALRKALDRRRRDGRPRAIFAVVHAWSGHNYELRYWLAACGIDLDRDVDIAFLPPSQAPDALSAGEIDGFCVGEPWNGVAVARGAGVIATTKASIWRSSPEKVLAVNADYAAREPDAVASLVRALWRAAAWCGMRENHTELAAILSRPEFVDADSALIEATLDGRIAVAPGRVVEQRDFFVPFARAATFPWKSHALWLYSQMVRWGHAIHTPETAALAADAYRPDIYRAALRPLGASLPAANAKVEGALTAVAPAGSTGGDLLLGPDGFFDGTIFDPSDLDAYIAAQRKGG